MIPDIRMSQIQLRLVLAVCTSRPVTASSFDASSHCFPVNSWSPVIDMRLVTHGSSHGSAIYVPHLRASCEEVDGSYPFRGKRGISLLGHDLFFHLTYDVMSLLGQIG